GLRAHHEAGGLEARHVVVVDLVAMAMALGDRLLAVDAVRERAAPHRARLGAESHRPAEVGARVAALDAPVAVLPLGHQRDPRVRGAGVELGGVRALGPALVARELDGGDLHAEADAEIWPLALARVLHRRDLALDAALAEASRHQHGI